MTLQDFNSKYRYKFDKEQFGIDEVLEVIKPSADGFYYGDCESYCLTIRAKVDGFEDLELWYCRVGADGHCVGRLNDMWIDNGTQRLVNNLGIKYHSFKKFRFYTIWLRMLKAKLVLWYNKK
jgi:hypothetical protein